MFMYQESVTVQNHGNRVDYLTVNFAIIYFFYKLNANMLMRIESNIILMKY